MKSLAQNHYPSLTTTVTGTGSDVTAPHETNAQGPNAFSDVLSRFECKLNHFQSAIQAPKARAATLTTVDEDIDAAKRLVLPFLTRRNMLVPISILPAEILARIFHFNAFSEQPYSPTPTLGWVYVTHVCRHWRQVALDDSTLWIYFSTFPRSKDWFAERLFRAGNAPLVIDLGGSLTRDTFSLFTPHISHTRELYLRGLSFRQSEVVQEFSMQEAPALERFELSGMGSSPMDTKHLVAHSLFKGQLPKLRIFCVSQMVFPWSLIPRSRLTQLKVTLNHEDLTPEPEVSSRDNLNQLVDLLVNCLALEVLTLDNCLPATLSESSGGQTIYLPRLSHLCLSGLTSRVTNLLKMLKLSSSTTLRLNCKSGYSATRNEHLILPVLSAHFNDPTPTEFRSFKIYLTESSRLDMIASTSFPILPIPLAYLNEADANVDTKLRLSLSCFRAQDFIDVVDMFLRRACDLLPFSKLEFLSISSPDRTQATNWGELFRHFTEVTTVQVYGRGTTGLLQALTPPPYPRGKGRKSRRGDKDSGTLGQASENTNNSVSAQVQVPIFPKLTSLLLEFLDFDEIVPGSGVLYNLVLNTIKRRKAKKTPVSTLSITQCVISAKEAAALEKIVRDFQWDHDEGNEDEVERDEADDFDYYDYDYNNFDPRDEYYNEFDYPDAWYEDFDYSEEHYNDFDYHGEYSDGGVEW